MPRHAQSQPSDNTRIAPVRVAAQTAIRRKQVTQVANQDYERLKKKYPNLANESYTYLVKFDRQHEANLAKQKSYSISQDNRNEQQKRNAGLAASDKQKEADEAQAYNTILRVFGESDRSTEEARANPQAVAEKMDEVKNNIADAALALYPAARGMSWLRGTGRLGNALYHSINGTLAAASGYDMYENGPNFWNTLGIAAPIMEYRPQFANLVGNKYAQYQFGKLLNEGLNTLSAISTGRYVKPYRLSREMNQAIKISEIPSAEIPSNVGWGPRQTISVTHKSDKALPLTLYNESRWDVINENANPLGVWFQGRFGIPRSTNTGATFNKAQKALKARQLFSRRPYTHSGDLTLDKPLVTVGDVPDRSLLSYKAEQMGADGLIYNNVYDNGYDANQVILSFKQPDNYMLTARAYKGGPRKSSYYEFFTTDPKYAHNFGQVKPYYVRSKFPVVTDTPLMGSRDISTMDAFAHDIGGGRPIDAIIGHDKVTGEFPHISQGDEILIFKPNQARLIDESPRLSFQERQGIPKVERNFRTHGHDYSNPADYGRLYQGRSVNPESSRFGSFIDDGSEASVFQDPDNPNMVLKVNTDWRGSLQDFFDKYVTKRNRVPFQKPLIVRGRTQEGFPVFNQEKVTPMTDEQYLQNLPRIREMLHQKGFVGDPDWGYISNEDMTIGDFTPGNVAFDSKGNIVFIDIDAYKKGGKLCKR